MTAKKMIQIGLANIILALAAGVYFRELTKYVLGDTVSSKSLTFMQTISLIHGHAFIMLVILPILFGVIGAIFGPIKAKEQFSWATIIYLIGAYGAWILMVYKGTLFTLAGAAGKDIVQANANLMPHWLRESLYGTFHLLLGIGAVWTAYILCKTVSSHENS